MDRIVASPDLIGEWGEVLSRPRFRRGTRGNLAGEIITGLLGNVDVVIPTAAVRDCRDPKDDKVLECALAAGADLIVSGDNDLLVLHPWRDIPILSPVGYLAA